MFESRSALSLRVGVLLCVVLFAGIGAEAGSPVFPVAVLCTFPNPQNPTPYDIPCQDRLDAYRLYALHANQQGGLLLNGIRYSLNISYFDVGYGTDANDIIKISAVAKKVIIDNAYGYFPVVIAPYSSLYTLVVAGLGEAAKRVVYASAAVTDLIYECPSPPNRILGADCISTGKRPGDRRYQYTFSTNPTAENRWSGLIYSVKVSGAQTLAMIDSTDLASQYQGTGAASAALANNMQIVTHTRLQGNQTLADRGLVDAWLAQLRQNYPNLDVLLINNWAELQFGCGTVILSLRAMNWLPKTVGCAFTVSTPDLINVVGDAHLQQYMVGSGNWDPRLQFTVDPALYPNDMWVSSIDPKTNNTRPDAALNAYISQATWRYPTAWTLQYNNGMYDMTILQRALAVMHTSYTQVTNTSDPQQMAQAALFTDALRQATQGLFEPTWFGRLQFDQVGRLGTDPIVGQAQGTPNAFDIIYPLASETAPFIYPIPTWDERVYSPGYGKLFSEKLVFGINAVVIAVSLALAGFVIVNRHAKTVKASSPIFLLCMLLGCILMNSSIYLWTMYETKSSCFAHVWLFSIGYILMFAPLFAKTWRLYRIFSSSNLSVQIIRDGKLFAMVCAPLLAFELIYLAVWSGVAPFEARTTVVDPLRPANNYDACYYNSASQGFFLASLAYKIAFLVAGCVLIFIARNIPSSFNETPFIGAAIYNVLFSSAILVPIVATDALGRESRFLVRSFGIMIATLLGQLIIVVPKMYHLISFGDVKLSTNKQSSSKPPSKHSSDDVELATKNMTKSSAPNTARTSTGSTALPGHPLSPSPQLNTFTLGSQEQSTNPYFHMTLQQAHAVMTETQIKLSQLQQVVQYKQQQQPPPPQQPPPQSPPSPSQPHSPPQPSSGQDRTSSVSSSAFTLTSKVPIHPMTPSMGPSPTPTHGLPRHHSFNQSTKQLMPHPLPSSSSMTLNQAPTIDDTDAIQLQMD